MQGLDSTVRQANRVGLLEQNMNHRRKQQQTVFLSTWSHLTKILGKYMYCFG